MVNDMASGCIMGECWICVGLVYEDEVSFSEGHMVHADCELETKTVQQYQAIMKILKKTKHRLDAEWLEKYVSSLRQGLKIEGEYDEF